MNKLALRSYLLTIVFGLSIHGCAENEPVVVEKVDMREQTVIRNTELVRDAVIAFAADNGGVYPRDVDTSQTVGGRTLVDYLPDGEMLVNPFTRVRSEPRDGTAAEPGEIGYLIFATYGPGAYEVVGRGQSGTVAIFSNIPDLEAQVIQNCLIIQAAVVAFAAENDGAYANDTGTDKSRRGNSITALLPGGNLLENPVTGSRTEPITGTAATAGQTGYTVFVQDGFNVGYTISCYGLFEGLGELLPPGPYENIFVRGNCLFLRWAVQTFAGDNNGTYPNDIDIDTTPAGDTVMDIIGKSLTNPYTGANTEPRNGPALLPGQVGYVPLSDGSVNVDYIINGWGEDSEILVFTKFGLQ